MSNPHRPDSDDGHFTWPPFHPFGSHVLGWILGLGAIVTVLILVGGTWYILAHNQTIYQGVSVAQIDLSNLSRDQARTKLADWAQRRAETRVALRYAEYRRDTALGELGFRLDVEAAVDSAFAIGRQGSWPHRASEIVGSLVIGRDVPWRSPGEIGQARAVLEQIADEINITPTDGQLRLVGTDVVTSPPHPGRYLDIDATSAQLLTVFEQQDVPLAIDLVVVDNVRPDIDEAQLHDAIDRVKRVVDGPLTFTFKDQVWELSPERLAAFVRCTKTWTDNQPVLAVEVDEQELAVAIDEAAREIDRPPVEAKWQFTGSTIEVTRDSQDGLQLDVASTIALARRALETGQGREIDLPVDTIEPALSSQEVRDWGVRELVAQATTDYFSGEERMHNVELGARHLNGALILPGEVFSLNDALGPVSYDTGFRQAYVIVNGQTVPGMGGGLCQIASTLFQAVFWGGYNITERYPHEYHMPRYESTWGGVTYKGLDATIDAGVNFCFENNGPSALYIQAYTDGHNLSISLYGTKPTWDVSITTYSIQSVRPAIGQVIRIPTYELPTGEEVQVEKSTDGFDSYITRRVTDGGSTISEYSVSSSYRATADVYLVGTAGPTETISGVATPSPSQSNHPSD